MRIRIFFSALILILAGSAAIGQFNKSTLLTQVNTQFPDNVTGAITPATTRTFLDNLISSWQQFAGYNKQVGAAYTVQASDYGQIVTFNNTGGVAVTLPPQTTFNLYVHNITTGNVVITPTGGFQVCGSSTLTLANNQGVWLVSDGSNWQCNFTLGTFNNGQQLDNITGFSGTGLLQRTAAGTYSFLTTTGGLTLSNIGNFAPLTTLCNPSTGNTTPTLCLPGQMSAVLCTPTVINYITASNLTYTTPTCNGVTATEISIEMVGGGGGGGGSGTGAGAAAGAGTASCWNSSGVACNSPLYTANGGAAGSAAGTTTFAAGGTSLNCDFNLSGGSARGSSTITGTNLSGANGGSSYFGGQGPGGPANGVIAGGDARANSGSGGGGGGGKQDTPLFQGSGGAAGGYCRKTIVAPAASYVVTVGTKGAAGGAGATGAAGGAGADGYVNVWARWQ